MKWNYLKGSEKDFANVNDGCVLVVQCRSDGHIYYLGNEFNPKSIEQCGGIIIAQREPIATPKHLMIFGDPKSFIFAHEEATHAAKNKVTGEVVHTHIPGLINLSKFDFIAQRQLTDVTESDLNECIGASEAIWQCRCSQHELITPEIRIESGEMHFNGHEYIKPISCGHKVKLSGHFEGNGFAAKLESKNLIIKIASDTVGITYSAGVFSASEIAEATECIKKLNEIVNKSSVEVIE